MLKLAEVVPHVDVNCLAVGGEGGFFLADTLCWSRSSAWRLTARSRYTTCSFN